MGFLIVYPCNAWDAGRFFRESIEGHAYDYNAFVQYNSASDTVGVNVRLRCNFHEGNDLHVVYNEALNTDRRRETPFLPLTDTRTILVKYTYTFAW